MSLLRRSAVSVPPAPVVQGLLVLMVLALAELPVAWDYLVSWPQDQWQVDLEVYREAARSVLYGRPVYEHLTPSPQLLPFTYPPFAALLAIPLALVPFAVAGWAWTVLQVLATYLTVLLAFRRLLRRAGGWRWLAGAVVTTPLLWLHPVADGVRFGQVNAFLVLACLADLTLVRGSGRLPWRTGALLGLATAIKLTPGVFLVHLALSRRWRELRTAVLAAALASGAAFCVLPEASLTFWTGALGDPNRLGPNAGTSNQSLRGVLLRLGPQGIAGTALWFLLGAAVAVVGFSLAQRAHRRGDLVTEVAAVGLMAVLLSPVAWIHHYAWIVVALGALVGTGRSRRGWAAAAVVLAWFLCRLPWWGLTALQHGLPNWFGRLLQNADTLGGLLTLALLWWLSDRQVNASGLKARQDGEQ